jgi:uncharacterized protein YuzE
MEKKLRFRYDRLADILYIDSRKPYKSQESQELDDDVIVRFNPKTGNIENIEVLFFSTRFFRSDFFELPIELVFHLNKKTNLSQLGKSLKKTG